MSSYRVYGYILVKIKVYVNIHRISYFPLTYVPKMVHLFKIANSKHFNYN